MTGDLVAQLKGASFSYYGAPETLHAVDLDVHAGECVVLMGASGSGKTTIVRVLNGLAGGYYRGSVSGDVFLGGLSARDMEAWRRAELVGSVFQDPTAQFFSSQLAGEVAFGCENIGYPAEEVVRRTDAAIGRLGLDRLRTIAVDELSSGQKQRVAIASSLAPAPRLVVMDEPSSNLDEDAAQELGAVLMELKRQGYALVVAEHRISYLMECADRFCYMEAGRMRAVLSRDDVFAMDGSERVAMGVRSPAFVPRPSLKPAPLAAGLAREGERAASGEAFGARLEAASLEVDGLAVSRGGNLLFSCVCFAVEPGQILMMGAGSASGSSANQKVLAFSVEIGLPLLIGAMLALYAALQKPERGENEKAVLRLLACGAALAVAATDFFPWGPVSTLTGGKVGYMQFTWRLLMFVAPLLALAGGYGVTEMGGKRPDAAAAAALCMAAVCVMPTLSGELHGARYIEQGATVSPHLGLAYAEYTLPDTNFLETRDRSLHIEGGVAVADYAKRGTTITAQVEAATEGTVSFPLFDYDGYRATLNGQEIAVETGDNNRVQIRVPAGTDGEVRIWFAGKRWWKITDAVSLAALLAVLLRRKFGKQA